MTGFHTDFVNQIATNLRDRYKSGFPILKELIQNADDAGAKSMVFGYHAGHGDDADHPLLKGPALWVLNDGGFKPEDRRAIRSFGLNAKAGDAGTIGKFGLGMKSVFHLCETFFYLAHDGERLNHDVLNPWIDKDLECEPMHSMWEHFSPRDEACLNALALAQAEAQSARSWFLLWVPLRKREHIPHNARRKTAAIIEQYPGEDEADALDFFAEANIDQRIGAVLPLLRNVESLRFAGGPRRPTFQIKLALDDVANRLDHKQAELLCSGHIDDGREKPGRLRFLVRQYASADPVFRTLGELSGWPSSMAITENGREPVRDKAEPETAVMFAHADHRRGRLSLDWAVFLPTEEGRFTYEAPIDLSEREYRVVLHGQFFVDAGRRGILDIDRLHEPRAGLPPNAHQDQVLRHWNQALAQEALLPRVLPALDEFVRENKLRDKDIENLTRALRDCAATGEAGARMGFFSTFRSHLCRTHAWVRQLHEDKARWSLLKPERTPLLPLPAPPESDPGRPWRTLPGLKNLAGRAFYDEVAPQLASHRGDWSIEALRVTLARIAPTTFTSSTDLDYLGAFLSMEALRFIRTAELQDLLVELLRAGLRSTALADIRSQRSAFQRVLSVLEPERLCGLGSKDIRAPKALPENLYQAMLAENTRALLVPADLLPDPAGTARTHDADDLGLWLRALAREGAKPTTHIEKLLNTAEALIEASGSPAEREAFVHRHRRLSVLRAFGGADGKSRAMSLEALGQQLTRARVFKRVDPQKPMGHVGELAAVVPELDVVVVPASVASWLASDSQTRLVPGTEDVDALFTAIGKSGQAPRLGSEGPRIAMLSLAGSALLQDEAAVRGVRYLLHGDSAHYLDLTTPLWKDPIGQQSPWVRLWRMVDDASWRVLSDNLCSAIPDKCARALNMKAVDAANVLRVLDAARDLSRIDASQFSPEERDQLLGEISDLALWKRLPLHEDVTGHFFPIDANCYLGSNPALPAGTDWPVRNVRHSAEPRHSANQGKCLCGWDAVSAAKIVLAGQEPMQHWEYLLGLATQFASPQDAPETWRTTPWLPLANGQAIALENLIRIETLDTEIQDLASRCGYSYASEANLADKVKTHPNASALKSWIDSDDAALPVLALMMDEAGYRIGAKASADFRDLDNALNTLSGVECLPAWSLIQKLVNVLDWKMVCDRLAPELKTPLPREKCEEAMTALRSQGSTFALRKAFNLYLHEWCSSDEPANLKIALPRLRLLSQAGHWKSPDKLVVGVTGGEPDSMLDDQQAKMLHGLVEDNSGQNLSPSVNGQQADTEWSETALHDALSAYFSELENSGVRQSAGTLIGLFGESQRALAEEWLDPLAYADFLEKLGWQDPGTVNGRKEWMGGKTVHEALCTLKIELLSHAPNEMEVFSLTGEIYSLPLVSDQNLDNLFIKADAWRASDKQTHRVHVHLRPVDSLLSRPLQEQRDILRRTAESLLKQLYNQPHVNLFDWSELVSEADQVTLEVARDLILQGLPQTLHGLAKTCKHPRVAEALKRLSLARNQRASAKHAKSRNLDALQMEEETALAALAELVEHDTDVQHVMLEGIRSRVKANQYELSSIPFELFQNADDAVVELQQLQREAGRAEFRDEPIGQFVMRVDQEYLLFAHRGRPINFSGWVGHQRLEYANDLERMLMLGASAKDDETEVTGQFGLGFKSVLLASDKPRVWSADLMFEIVAGCLPQKIKPDGALKDFQGALKQGGSKGLRETLIELPLSDAVSKDSISGRFRKLAGLLPVFAHRLNRVEIDGEEHRWAPISLELDCTVPVDIGQVLIPVRNGQARCKLLVFRCRAGRVILRLGRSGVESFDEKAEHPVPAIWVTAPTRGTPASGVVLNACFQIDTGRATLAHSANAGKANAELAMKLAEDVAFALSALMSESQRDWPSLAARLGCAETVSVESFWFSLWHKLMGDAPDTDSTPDAKLLDAFACEVLSRYLARGGMLPNGLSDSLAALVSPGTLSLALKPDYLGEALGKIQEWPGFVASYPLRVWCTEDVRKWLGRTKGEAPTRIAELSIPTLIESLKNAELSPEDASCLARIIQSWPANLGEPARWMESLRSIKLRGADGHFVPVNQLLQESRQRDELIALLLRFAPDSAQVHPDYAAEAMGVLVKYMTPLSPDLQTLAMWCLKTTEIQAKKTVVRWLMSQLHTGIFQTLAYRKKSNTWLFLLMEDSPELEELRPTERQLFLESLGLVPNSNPVQEIDKVNFSLNDIRDWWQDRRDHWLLRYDAGVWPSGFDRRRLQDENDREAWMTLFALGVFRRYGRTIDAQHKGFIEFLAHRGWWTTICETQPRDEAEAWMNILREYGEAHDIEPLFELWMDSYPRLYRVAAHLDVYVQIFRTLDQRARDEMASTLTPNADSILSGSGLDAPTLKGMLRHGQHFIIRELLRAEVLHGDVVQELAFTPKAAVRQLLREMGSAELALDTSEEIYQILKEELGEEDAHFQGDFDIPLQLIASDPQARQELAALKAGSMDDESIEDLA